MLKRICISSLLLILLLGCAAPAWGAELGRQQMLVNKGHTLAADYVPSGLVNLNEYMTAPQGVQLQQDAAEAMWRLVQAAAADGVTGFNGQSGYRSYAIQSSLYAKKTAYYQGQGYGAEAALQAATVVAPPGASEHQSGLALDITTAENGYSMTSGFAQTQVGQWLAANCWKYGFILRYPQDKIQITGFIYEPWHFRYVGVPHAEYMSLNGLCLEEYIELLKSLGVLEYTDQNGFSYQINYSSLDICGAVDGVVTCLSVADTACNSYITTVRPWLFDLQNHWSEDEVRPLAQLGLISGYPDGSFRPGGHINRAELVTLVNRTWQLLHSQEEGPAAPEAPPFSAPVFADVSRADYYFDSLMKMYEAGLVASSLVRTDVDGRLYFDGMEKVLRSQAAESLAPLFRALPQAEGSGAELLDMYQQDPGLRQAVQLLVDYGVVKGDDLGNFNPNGKITRAEIAAILNRIIEYYQTEADQG